MAARGFSNSNWSCFGAPEFSRLRGEAAPDPSTMGANSGAEETIRDPRDERELVAAATAGDLNAYDELVQRCQERIYATIYHMTSNHEDANDLVQETFIKGFRALKSFRGGSSFYTWVYRIAVNRTINFLKQRKKRYQMSLNDLDTNVENDPDLVAMASEDTPRRDVQLTELQGKLNEALMKLSDQHRLAVVLHDVQGLPHDEIARIMECNVGTVRSRLFYARQQLQGLLADYLS